MHILIEIERAQFSETPEFLRSELEEFTRRLAAFYARPAVPAVHVQLLDGNHVLVAVDALLRLQGQVIEIQAELQRKAGVE